jgi:hypothetical protein
VKIHRAYEAIRDVSEQLSGVLASINSLPRFALWLSLSHVCHSVETDHSVGEELSPIKRSRELSQRPPYDAMTIVGATTQSEESYDGTSVT